MQIKQGNWLSTYTLPPLKKKKKKNTNKSQKKRKRKEEEKINDPITNP